MPALLEGSGTAGYRPAVRAGWAWDAREVTSVAELWVGDPVAAIDFYVRGPTRQCSTVSGSTTRSWLELAIGDARVLVSTRGTDASILVIGGTTSRTLLGDHGTRAALRWQSRPALNQPVT